MSETPRPYSEAYLKEVMETQGRFFERLQDEPAPIDSASCLTVTGASKLFLDPSGNVMAIIVNFSAG